MLCLTCSRLCFLCPSKDYIHACSQAPLQIFLQQDIFRSLYIGSLQVPAQHVTLR